tara:strand:- start:1920 stop:2522 length:603 start_codon:yes stop_codon:yes gene_type:complete
MRKQTKSELRKISENLDYFFNLATDEEITEGKQWYKLANQFCTNVAHEYKTDPLKVASVVSALSPRNRWTQNLIDAKKVFKAIEQGKSPEDIKVCTFHKNKFKAFELAKGNIFITDDSPKTYNFVRNIAHLDPSALTIDIWHIRACLKQFKNIGSAQIGKVAYKQIKALTIKKANKLGLTGYEYQAIIWLSIQNNLNKLK